MRRRWMGRAAEGVVEEEEGMGVEDGAVEAVGEGDQRYRPPVAVG